jgi:hypothetical protein
MSDQPAADPISRKRVVYTIAGMNDVVVRKDVTYRTADAGALTLDLYRPSDVAVGARLPAVLIVEGYSDVGFARIFGCPFKETGMVVSLAQLIAASGMAAIAYTNRQPAADLDALLVHIGDQAEELGVEGERIGLWAGSGNVPVALSALMSTRHTLRCAALFYGYMLDLDGATGVADAAGIFRFANPAAGRSMDDLPRDVALFVVRAGQEQFAGLNDSIDRFVAKALGDNRPITLINHATGVHSFDLLQDGEASREILRQALSFLRSQLTRAGS